MDFLFWSCVLFITYIYIGYPGLVLVCARLSPAAVQIGCLIDDKAPSSVAIVLTVHNEAALLVERLDNLLSLALPGQQVWVVVVSDGSTDTTNELLAQYPVPQVRSVIYQPNRGKPSAVNAALALIEAELAVEFVVFADARQNFRADCLNHLLRPFSDPDVAAVSGNLVIRDESDAEVSGAYWKYEKAIRKAESRLNWMVGVTGAIYALRHSACQPIPESMLVDDMYVPLRLRLTGAKVVFAEGALAYDRPSTTQQEEFQRKVRTLYGNWQVAATLPALNSPSSNPIWLAWMSHKLGRLLVPFASIIAIFAGLASTTLFVQVSAIAGLFTLIYLALAQRYARLQSLLPLYGLLNTFVSLNLAALVATYRFWFGKPVTWIKH